DEVCPRLDPVVEPDRLVLEVDAVERRVGREAPPVRDDELELVGQRPLAAPGRRGADDAAVHEQDAGPLHIAILTITKSPDFVGECKALACYKLCYVPARMERGRLLPVAGGAVVVAVALPGFLIVDWRVQGWALGAILWLATLAVDLLLTRVESRAGNLAASGVQAFGIFFKAVGLLVVLLATAVTAPHLAAAAAIVYV